MNPRNQSRRRGPLGRAGGARHGPGTWLWVVVVAAAWPSLGGVLDHRWCEIRTPHFRLVSDLSESRARRLADDLLRFHAAASTIVEQDAGARVAPLDVVAFRRSRHLRATFGVRSVAGFSASSPRGFTVVIGPRYGRLRLDNSAAFHEYAHYLMNARPVRYYPLWYSEGFASLLSTLAFEDDRRFVFGRIPFFRLRNAVRDYNLPLAEVVGYRHELAPGSEDFLMVYERAWVMIHYLMFGHLAGFPSYADRLPAALERIDAGADSREALEAALGVELGVIEAALGAYALVRDPPAEVRDYRWADAPLERRCLDREAVTLFFAGATAARNPDFARAGYETLLRADPDRVEVLVGLSRLDPGRASALAGRALALAPEDPDALIRAAELDVAECGRSCWESALERYRAALAQTPERGDAALQLGALQLARGDARSAVRALEAALALNPWRRPIHLYLGEAYRLAGNPEAAARHLRRAAVWHPDAGARLQAGRALAALGAGLPGVEAPQ